MGCVLALFVLVGASVCPAQIQNPSFEMTYDGLPWPRPLPTGWGEMRTDHPSFNSLCTDLWSTDGELSAGLHSRINFTVSRGNYQSFGQWVDLTDIGSIVFDVRLAAYPAGEFANFEASLVVSIPYLGVPPVALWQQAVGGVYLNQQVDVSHLSGWYFLEIRNTAQVAGKFPLAYWTQWDNFRFAEGTATVIPALVHLEPGTLNLNSGGKWITCYINLGEGDEVGLIDGSTVMLEEIPAHIGGYGWATAEASEGNIVDIGGDGSFERMVKFDRAAVAAIVEPPEATLLITGALTDGRLFAGEAVLRVLDPGRKKK